VQASNVWDFLHPANGGYAIAGQTAYILARAQFGFTMAFHIALAAISIGLSTYLMVLEALWLRTRRQAYIDAYNYWLKVVALNFAVGAVTGVFMEYQIGTNWGGLAARIGDVIGPLLLYEVMVAFFLEAGFLGIMLFGMNRVGPRLHFLSTSVVALGSLFSAFWILSAISWMQTPDGFAIGPDGRFLPQDWMKIIFNPSFPYRFVHMTLAAFLVTAFIVAAFAGWHVLHTPGTAWRVQCCRRHYGPSRSWPHCRSWPAISMGKTHWSISHRSWRRWKGTGIPGNPAKGSR
jgi:cytochrome d ubiquinol oxidase subunit I